MRKMLSAALLMCIVAVLALSTSAVHATKPMDVEGHFDYISYLVSAREADGNLFVKTEEDVWWYGDIDGITLKEESKCRVVMHSTGDWWYTGLYKVTDATVDSKEGSFVIHAVGKKPEGEDWFGHWVIISGTDELADLRGRGAWGGPGFDPSIPTVPGYIWYEGKIHFD